MYFAIILCSKKLNFGFSAIRLFIHVLFNCLFWKYWITDNKFWLAGCKSGFLLCSLQIFKIFLDHLFLALPCNFNSNICIMSDVSNILMANIFKLHQEVLEFLTCINIASLDLGFDARFPFYTLLWFCKVHHIYQWAII